MTTSRNVVDFDHHSDAFSGGDFQERIDSWGEIRNRCPVSWNPNYGGFWVLADFESAAQASRDAEGFLHHYDPVPADGLEYCGQLGIPRPTFVEKMAIGEVDGPFHQDLRRALNPLFTPARARSFRADFQQIADWFVDQHITTGRIDLINDFLAPVAAMTTMHMLGLPLARWKSAVDVFHGLNGFSPDSAEYTYAKTVQSPALMAEFLEIALARRAAPTDDVVTAIAALRTDGELLNDHDLTLVLFNLVSGGVDTTAGFTGISLRFLDRDRAAWQLLIDQPELMEPAIEEFLRLFGSVAGLTRTVARDVVVGGQELRRGERALIVHNAANRDPREFPNPDAFDPHRERNRHLAFGMSAHRCIGAHIARVNVGVMLSTLLARMPDFAILDDEVVEYSGNPELFGLKTLPATFTPGASMNTPDPA